MSKKDKKQKNIIKDLIILQFIVVIYTLSGVAAKFAAGGSFLSVRFILCYAIEIGLLGIYAILWQQMIKKFDLSIAYANRSIALLWSMIWATIIFGEKITLKNIIGVMIVIAGTIIINSDDYK